MATVRKIAQNPEDFLDSCEKFDLEASALVWDEVARRSPANRILVTKFELSFGTGPLPSEIALAAGTVLGRLEVLEQNRGRPYLALQTNLACELGRIFRGYGGRITRITFDSETGPFHEFLNLILPAVRTFAKNAGFDLNITTMVEKAQTYRDVKPRKNNGISATQLIP